MPDEEVPSAPAAKVASAEPQHHPVTPAPPAARIVPTPDPGVSADSGRVHDDRVHDEGPQLRYDADADDYVAGPIVPAVQRAITDY
jgi:hypothetical protein